MNLLFMQMMLKYELLSPQFWRKFIACAENQHERLSKFFQ